MTYDFLKFFQDYNITYEGPNSRNRYILECPILSCGSSSGKKHGSIHILSQNSFYCFKCGHHTLDEVIPLLTNGQQWRDIKLNYKTELDVHDRLLLRQKPKKEYHNEILILPKGDKGLNDKAYQYLYKRGFDPVELIDKYNIYSTGHLGFYRFRIIIPIYFNHKLISFTGRDYSELVPKEERYLSCFKKDEVIPHKNIIYGIDNIPGNHVIIVEGVPDKWMLGEYAAAIFGIAYSTEQVICIANRFEKVTILFDNDSDAKRQADKLGNELSGLGLQVNILYLKENKDPGSFRHYEAEDLVRKILRR